MRALLNTWFVANDSRSPIDRFEEESGATNLPAEQADTLRELRDDLRVVVETGPAGPAAADQQDQQDQQDLLDLLDLLDRWIERLALRPTVRAGALVFRHDGTAAGTILAVVLGAVADQRWNRLKACPDCRWVFYDHTRNGSKRWCLMYAGGPSGRACGTIAKVRRHRRRRSQDVPVPDHMADAADD